MTNKKTLMTGIFSALHFGFTGESLVEWSRGFVIAFPVAFLLSLVVSPLAFRLAHAFTGR